MKFNSEKESFDKIKKNILAKKRTGVYRASSAGAIYKIQHKIELHTSQQISCMFDLSLVSWFSTGFSLGESYLLISNERGTALIRFFKKNDQDIGSTLQIDFE